ncbi:MAG TPA: hypothetical protein EYP56_12895, partial [Planctomycetaceae bacterium]|nr:hypothetical protein [Planctomycetaceae bacterium]
MAGSPKKAMWVVGLLLPGAGVFGLMGCNSEPVSSGQRTSTLGEPLDEPLPQQTVGSHTDDLVGTTLAVEGEIVQQCPAAGCWFRVKDKTGELFVDLKPAGLRLTESRVGQRVQVTGRVEKT